MEPAQFKLLYDGQCPFCRLEVRWMQRWNKKGRLAFEDIAAPDFDPARFGLTQKEVMGIIHGVFPDGRIVRRLEAFREAYRAVGLGWLVALTGWPVVRHLFNWLYEVFARNRLRLGRLFGERCDAGRCGVGSRPSEK